MRWVLAGAALGLAACAGSGERIISAEAGEAASAVDCAAADWASIGQRDGLYGEEPGKLAERMAQCRNAGPEARQEYERGWQRGLATYCTPDAGFDAGRNGRDYRGVCPAEVERPFLAEYEAGRNLFDLTTRIASTKAALALAVSTVESDRFELKRSLDRVSDMNATSEDKSRAVENVERYRQNIGALEEEIPKLRAAIGEAEAALQAHRASAARK